MNLQNLKMQNYFQVIDGLGLVFEGFDSNEDSMFTNPVYVRYNGQWRTQIVGNKKYCWGIHWGVTF